MEANELDFGAFLCIDDQALDAEDPAPLEESSPFDDILLSGDDDAVSIEDDNMVPELSVDMVSIARVQRGQHQDVSLARHFGRDLEVGFVGVSEALFRYWKSHRITNKNRLVGYLINTNNAAGHFNRLLWPQSGKRGYKELLAYEKNGRLTDWAIARRVAAAQRGEAM
ncbi:hypothetical protein QFC20_003242 [Naganishia adeliensis]|uniref:Uncharacterized protein n=1 Tax=Naganishia adeliensis TaxID=92952 RepID=A0ACC2WG58_9TREE|nr:hypothetical protein QFC20_003242 [Naganishia adeliensis]